MKTIINGVEADIYCLQDTQGIDICVDRACGNRPYICRINNDGTLTLYNKIDSIFQHQGAEKNIVVKKEFD